MISYVRNVTCTCYPYEWDGEKEFDKGDTVGVNHAAQRRAYFHPCTRRKGTQPGFFLAPLCTLLTGIAVTAQCLRPLQPPRAPFPTFVGRCYRSMPIYWIF